MTASFIFPSFCLSPKQQNPAPKKGKFKKSFSLLPFAISTHLKHTRIHANAWLSFKCNEKRIQTNCPLVLKKKIIIYRYIHKQKLAEESELVTLPTDEEKETEQPPPPPPETYVSPFCSRDCHFQTITERKCQVLLKI